MGESVEVLEVVDLAFKGIDGGVTVGFALGGGDIDLEIGESLGELAEKTGAIFGDDAQTDGVDVFLAAFPLDIDASCGIAIGDLGAIGAVDNDAASA